MKAAFAVWNDRIAPVFDVAGHIHLVEIEDGKVVRETSEVLSDDLPSRRALRLAELGAGTLVCGAISRPLHELVAGYGIKVVPFVAGDLREVLGAWLAGSLDGEAFAMPGCFGRGRRRFRGAAGGKQEEFLMNEGGRGGMGRGRGCGQGGGRGQGRGRGGPRAGLGGGPAAAGPGGLCVCPQCGFRQPHERGAPCAERACPRCGAAMARN